MEFCHVQDVCNLPDKLTTSATHARGGRSPSGQHVLSLRRVPVNVLEDMYSTLARSYRPHRKHSNDKWTMSILSHTFSKLGVSPTLGYKHQRHRPGSGIGDGTNHTQSAGSLSRLVVDSKDDAESSVNSQLGRQKQRKKRRVDDDEPVPPKRLAMHDDESNGRRLLCPFYVKNRCPRQQCSKYRFKRVADVRQHLVRIHIEKPHCPNCGMTFDNDLSHEQRNRHIAARTCQSQSFITTGITKDQFDTITEIARQRTHHRDSAAERWLKMWRVIFPGAEETDSPYESEETDLIQGMLDTRAALENGRFRTQISGTLLEHFGPHEISVINAFIDLARESQSGHNDAARVEDFPQVSLALASTQTAQGSSISAPSLSIQPTPTQAGGLELATNTLAHAPPLVQPLVSGDPNWAGTYQLEIGEGSSQPWENQQISWDDFQEEFGYLP